MKLYVTFIVIIGITTLHASQFEGMESIEINGHQGWLDGTPLHRDIHTADETTIFGKSSFRIIGTPRIVNIKFEGDAYSGFWDSYEVSTDTTSEARIIELEKEILVLKDIIKSLEAKLQKLESASQR